MSKRFCLLGLFFYIFILAGCVSTNLTAVTAPDVDLKTKNNILVFYNLKNLRERKMLEDYIVKEFSKNSIKAYSYTALFPPLKEYTKEEQADIIKQNNIENILQIEFINGTSSNVSSAGYVVYNTVIVDNDVNISLDLEVSFSDIESGDVLLTGSINSEAVNETFNSSLKEAYKSVAKKIVNTYFKKKIVYNSEVNPAEN